VRILTNQTTPDKTSKPGVYPLIDTKNTISCSNEFSNLVIANQDNISLITEDLELKIPPSEDPRSTTDPCAEPFGGWFQTTGRRPVLWKGLIEAPNGPGYERMYNGTPLYQYFYVRVPYNWDYESDFGTVFATPTWDWQFTVDYSITGGTKLYQWRYNSTNGLHLVENGGGSFKWNLAYKIGKLSDWQCSGENPYKDNAMELPCTFLITPDDYACAEYVVLRESPFGSGDVNWVINLDLPVPSYIPWNSYLGSTEGGPWTEVIITIQCGTPSVGYVLARGTAGGTIWDWKISGGRYNTYPGTCDFASGWLAWSFYNMNDRNNSLWYPKNNNCCNGDTEPPVYCLPGLDQSGGVGDYSITYLWETNPTPSDFLKLTIFNSSVYYFPTFNINRLDGGGSYQQSLNFGVISTPTTKTINIGQYPDGYYNITNGGLPILYYCHRDGATTLYETNPLA
jgi:hypothetical protein